ERLSAGMRLRKFILMMREPQIQAAAVDIELVTQILGRHGRTFQMPSRATTPPGRLPRSGPRLNILVALPEREIARITFAFCRGVFGGLHVVETLVRQFAVIGPGMNIEV